MKKQIIKKIILENQKFITDLQLYKRDFIIEEKANYVFIGSRRAGKSYFMYQIAQDLLLKKIKKENILFINFEDERFIEFNVEHFDLLIESYKELYNLEPVFFLDEIQNIDGWEKFVRRLADKNYRVFVTGSNAKMLSSEIATTLGGRFMIKEIQSLSFKEFLQFNKVILKKNYEFSEQKNTIKRLLNEYFLHGGFPEILNFTNKREYLSSLYQKVLYGDILARYTIQNKQSMRLLVKKMAESVNDETSFNRIRNLIKSTGTNVTTSTIIEYFEYLKDSFLLFDLQNYASKFTERETKKKFYFTDNGILSLFMPNDKSKLLENLVYTELRRRYSDGIYFYKKNYETDFYISETSELIQVSYTLYDDKTRNREVKSLKKAMPEFDTNKGLILTYDDVEEEIIDNEFEIKVLPIWKWLLK